MSGRLSYWCREYFTYTIVPGLKGPAMHCEDYYNIYTNLLKSMAFFRVMISNIANYYKVWTTYCIVLHSAPMGKLRGCIISWFIIKYLSHQSARDNPSLYTLIPIFPRWGRTPKLNVNAVRQYHCKDLNQWWIVSRTTSYINQGWIIESTNSAQFTQHQ